MIPGSLESGEPQGGLSAFRGFKVWISSSCAADGTALPAPTQLMPTPKSCALRAQIWPAG